MIESALFVLVGTAIIAGAVYDAATLTIPNWISLILIVLFPFVAISAGLTWGEAGVHLGIGFGALVVGILLFAGGIIGGGDAKLFAAVSLYIGTAWLGYAFAVALAGGAVACVLIALRWLAASGFGVHLAWLQHLVKRGAGIPYGVAIAAGALFVLPSTHLFLSTTP